MSRPSLLMVVHRYGDVVGGAETLTRLVAERLVEHADIQVATTAAADYWSWANDLPVGERTENGVPVVRFPVERGRRRDFKRRERAAYLPVHDYADEEEFLEAQGPCVPELLEHLVTRGAEFDAIVFFTYLYYTTARGVPLVPERAMLVPTAHEEPPLALTFFKRVFHAPRVILYNTEEERELVHEIFKNERVPSDVVGMAVEAPDGADGDRFRARHGIAGPMLLYLGRITEAKSCDHLFRHFARWRDSDPRRRRATLVLGGSAEMRLPRRDDVRHVGVLSETEKLDAYAAADLFVMPSRFESLSIVTLEAMAQGRAVVCNGASPVLAGLCRRSAGGLYYRGFAEFAEVLDLLLADADVRARLGAAGREHVRAAYSWPRVVEKYLDAIAEVRARNAPLG